MAKPVWSWVEEPRTNRPQTTGPGRYARPLAIRDKIVVKAFGEEVRRLRLMRKISTQEVADKMGMSQPSITYIEKGKGNIELRLLFDFADVFGVKPSSFIRVCEKAIDTFLESRPSN